MHPSQAQDQRLSLAIVGAPDLLVAGLVKDPEDAGRMIAAAITQAEAPAASAIFGSLSVKFVP
jgi:hypothetical protein